MQGVFAAEQSLRRAAAAMAAGRFVVASARAFSHPVLAAQHLRLACRLAGAAHSSSRFALASDGTAGGYLAMNVTVCISLAGMRKHL